MNSIEIALQIEPAAAVLGESLIARVTLTNHSAQPVEIVEPLMQSVCTYLFTHERPGAEAMRLSEFDANNLRYPNDYIPPALNKRMLAPGAFAVYVDDLARFMLHAPEPGRYHVVASCPVGESVLASAPQPLAIVAPDVRVAARVVGPSDNALGQVIAHANGPDARILLQAESRGGAPADGVWYRRTTLHGAGETSLAAAIELEPNRGARWFAWLHDAALGAALGDADDALLFEPAPNELRQPLLHPWGWQSSNESALFAMLGVNAQARATFALAGFDASGARRVKLYELVRAAPELPSRWGAQFRLDAYTPSFDLVTVDADRGSVAVRMHGITLDADQAVAATTLFDGPGDVAAFALDPLRRDVLGVADVLLTTAAHGGELSLLRLGLRSGDPLEQWRFAVPRADDGTVPAFYALATTPLDDPFVLAQRGEQLLVRRARHDAAWTILATDCAKAQYPQLVVLGAQDVWAVWGDPKRGMQYRRIP